MSVARAYARALYEAAVDGKASSAELDKIAEQLASVAAAARSSREARVAFEAPSISAKERTKIVEAVSQKISALPLVGNFLKLMARKERLALITEVAEAYREVRLEAEGGVLGRVVSADPLSEEDLRALSGAFTQKLGKKVSFSVATDPSLLAGVRVTVSGTTYDGTLKAQLQRLKDRLVYGTGAVH